MSAELIEAGPAHAEILAALHAATIAADDGGAWSGEWVARIVALPGAFAVLALWSEPIGFALCLPAGAATDLVAIGVLTKARRRGIGGRLLRHCLARAKAAASERLMLEVADDNSGALAFYRDAGFAELTRRPRYYRPLSGGTARDAVVLAKSL
jgi:ribosomal protein S18 acetylase RimI-like enzyme